RLRVEADDGAARLLQEPADVERRRVAHVVAVGLEGEPEHRDAVAADGVELALDERGHAVAAAQVDAVDLTEERERLGVPELARARLERPDVLRQASAAEAEAGVEEAPPDA